MRRAEFIIKISKYCNLRCGYCYEFPNLGDRKRLSIDDLRAIFQNIAEFTYGQNYELNFLWHGGEPLLIPRSYYEQIGWLQQDVFGRETKIVNQVQTNLTVMNDQLLEFLKSERFFKQIGISFDVYGSERVDTNGRPTTEKVLKNMSILIENGVEFGVITVLARNTLPYVREIVRFFDSVNVPAKFLPFYRHASDEQIHLHGLSQIEYVSALCTAYEEWLISPNAIWLEPVSECISYALAYVNDKRGEYYRKQEDELVVVVNTDGSAWGQDIVYESGFSYGNLLKAPLNELLASDVRRRALAKAHTNENKHCSNCEFYGYCPGVFVQNATADQQISLDQFGCAERKVISYILHRLPAGLESQNPNVAGVVDSKN